MIDDSHLFTNENMRIVGLIFLFMVGLFVALLILGYRFMLKNNRELKHFAYYDSLTEFNIEDISISSIGFTSDYELNVRIRLEYNWKQTDKETGEVESDDTYNYYSFYLVPEEDTYKVVGMSSLPSTVSLWW